MTREEAVKRADAILTFHPYRAERIKLIADALMAVQRETAEKCAGIADESGDRDAEEYAEQKAYSIRDEIREEFGLEG